MKKSWRKLVTMPSKSFSITEMSTRLSFRKRNTSLSTAEKTIWKMISSMIMIKNPMHKLRGKYNNNTNRLSKADQLWENPHHRNTNNKLFNLLPHRKCMLNSLFNNQFNSLFQRPFISSQCKWFQFNSSNTCQLSNLMLWLLSNSRSISNLKGKFLLRDNTNNSPCSSKHHVQSRVHQ